MSKKQILLILLCKGCFCLQPLWLYAQPFNFTVYREADGLPSGYVQTAFEDNRGYLWLCTLGGLSRFDGRNFKNYDITNGLSDNFCDEVCEDKTGNLWIATRAGLCYFDGKKCTSISYPANLTATYFSALKVDENNDLHCILNAQNAIVSNGKFEYVNLLENVPGLPAKKYVADTLADGTKIVNTDNGVYLVSKQKKARLISAFNNLRTYIKIDAVEKNAFYLFNENGLYHWQDGQLKSLTTIDFHKQIVTVLFVDAQKRIWLSAEDKGVWIIDKNKTSFIDKSELPGYLIPSIYQDKRGVIWICTFRGLVKLTNQFATHYTKVTGLDNEDIRFSNKLTDGSICMQTNLIKNGNVISLPGNLPKLLTHNHLNAYLRGLQVDEKNKWWIFAMDNNIYTWQNQHIAKSALSIDYSSGPANFYDITNGELWFTKDNVVYIAKEGKLVKSIAVLSDGTLLNHIISINKDYFGHIWVSERGRLLLNTDKGFIDFTPNLQLPKKIFAEIACSSQNGIWFKTHGLGAIHFSFVNNQFIKDKIINTDNGLPNNFIHDIKVDNNSNVWIATLSGLYRFTEKQHLPNTYNIRNFTSSDRIDVPNWNLAFLEKDSLQNIWLGVANGIFKINTLAITETASAPSVLIDNVTVLNDNNAETFSSKGFQLNTSPADFDAGQNDIAFHFNGINLNNNFIRYAYILNSRDKNWVTNQTNNEAIYYNLSPGKYSFIVKAINDAGIESKTAEYTFTIVPPFWQRAWFRTLVVLAAIGAIYWFIKRRDAIKEKENLAALQMSELKLTALQSQMNPHFIFNSLNSIQNYILQQKPVEAAKYLSKFSKLMRRILDQSFNNLTPLYEIVETLKMYMELEAFRFSNEFSWEVIVADAESISDVRLPPLLLQPYVENAIIHGLMPKEGDKKLLINLYKKNNELHCVIDDNGVGRSNKLNGAEGHISHGQKLTADMLATMKQLLHTDAQIQITDKTDLQHNAAGTTVDLIIPLSF